MSELPWNLRPTVVNMEELLRQLEALNADLKDEHQFKRAGIVHKARRELERLAYGKIRL
jgi:uncharacterized protein (DUF3084 family)